MLFNVCTKCNHAKWLHDFGLRHRNGSYTYKSWCKDCESKAGVLRNRKRFKRDENFRLQSLKRVQDWTKENKTRRLEADAKRRRLKYSCDDEYKALKLAEVAKRRAAKLQATPPWLSEEQTKDIEAIYKVCAKVSKKTGKPHDVDHIIPLQGELVCGLHVPWNLQILPSGMNRAKGNAFDTWDDFAT